MNYIFYPFLAIMVAFSACKKESNNCNYSNTLPTVSQSELASLGDYIDTNNITAQSHSSGYYYYMDQGTGASPNVCSFVTVRYKASIIPTGQVVDQTEGVSTAGFTLGQLVPGVKSGLQLLKEGGHIVLYLPASLAYGSQGVKNSSGQYVIPPNTPLKFEFHLVSVN